ncbi:hypothetical protein D3C84_956680 [compost metagenome]
MSRVARLIRPLPTVSVALLTRPAMADSANGAVIEPLPVTAGAKSNAMDAAPKGTERRNPTVSWDARSSREPLVSTASTLSAVSPSLAKVRERSSINASKASRLAPFICGSNTRVSWALIAPVRFVRSCSAVTGPIGTDTAVLVVDVVEWGGSVSSV